MVARALRVGWAVLSLFMVESIVFALAALPATLFWMWHLQWTAPPLWLRVVFLSMALFPAYLIFALALMVLSAGASKLLGWRTVPDAEMRVRDYDWTLLDWVRYVASTHLVRLLAGSLFRATPIWSFYLRMNGARVGRGVYVNSLALMDHNLLEFGAGTIVGTDVRLSGHIVEGGVVKTARARIGSNVTLGTGCVIGIGVEIGENAQVGALSLVTKYARLEANAVYVGIPARRVNDTGPAPPA